MRQRVGLARALTVDAKVLLMDEPFSAVDEQTRRKFQEDLLALVAQERKTFLFVTHSIEEAVYVSDRIVLLSRRPSRVSQIVEPNIPRAGDPEDIRRDRKSVVEGTSVAIRVALSGCRIIKKQKKNTNKQ